MGVEGAARSEAAASAPVIPIQAPVLHGLGNVLRRNRIGAAEVGDRAGDLENTVVGAGREAHSPDSHLERPLARLVERAQFPKLSVRDVSVVEPSPLLALASRCHTVAHLVGSGPVAAPAQLFVRHSGHFDVQVDPVQQRTADLRQVSLNDRSRAPAFPRRIAKIAARTSLRCLFAICVFEQSDHPTPLTLSN